MIVVILTPLPVEYRAVQRHLSHRQVERHEGDLYESGQFQGLHHTYEVVIRETGSKNSIVALAAERAVRFLGPSLIFLTGVAGSIKDARIGDVVVGTKAYGYESGKETADGPVSRPEVLHYDATLIETARLVSRRNDWRRRAPDEAPDARILFGPIASGDKVIATSDSPLYRYLKLHYNDTVALEMESIGFATATSSKLNLKALNVRGISDLLDYKSDIQQQMASEHAAAFLFELLYQLNLGELSEKSGSFTPAHSIKKILHQDIAEGRIPEVLQQLIKYTDNNLPNLKQEALLLSDRREQLARKVRMGVISNSEATLERNQITASLLELIEKIP